MGFRVNIDQLPIRKEMIEAIGFDESISMALSGGDDYELCFTVPAKTKDEFEKDPGLFEDPFYIKKIKLDFLKKDSMVLRF